MYRKCYEQLVAWKNRSHGTSAMLIEGARRVGKSWLAEEFAKREYDAYLLINFSYAESDIRALFDNYLRDLDTFFHKLLNAYSVTLPPRKSLIIFDEVQLCPRAREAIKPLVIDGRYDYLETGSLVSLRENTSGILLPSEEESITLLPMDFEEFAMALGKSSLYEQLREGFAAAKPLGSILHRQAMDLLREYMIVGGMPQAVFDYLDDRQLAKADARKRQILKLYRDDIASHSKRYSLKTRQLFDDLPAQLSTHDRRFRPSALNKQAATRTYEDALFWLEDAKIILPCFNATEPNVGLKLNRERPFLKCYMADTGLLLSHSFDERRLQAEEIHHRILCQSIELNQGMFLENLVAQMLVASGHPLYFFSKTREKSRAEEMEIDFLIAKSKLSQRHNISPLEVKSGKRTKLASLNKFRTKYQDYVSQPIVLHTGDWKIQDGITYLPVYLTPFL